MILKFCTEYFAHQRQFSNILKIVIIVLKIDILLSIYYSLGKTCFNIFHIVIFKYALSNLNFYYCIVN